MLDLSSFLDDAGFIKNNCATIIWNDYSSILWFIFCSCGCVQQCVFPAVISVNITMIDSGSWSDQISEILRTQRSAVLYLLQAVLSIYGACMSRYESHETNKSTVRSWIYSDRQKRPSVRLWLRFGAGPDPVASGRSSDIFGAFSTLFWENWMLKHVIIPWMDVEENWPPVKSKRFKKFTFSKCIL